MDTLDTGKLTLKVEEDGYIQVCIYTDDELTEEDIPPIRDYFYQFKPLFPVMIVRQGHYTLSIKVQAVLWHEVKAHVSAIAYVDRNHRDTLLTRLAANTYMKDAEVKSFRDRSEAAVWLKQFPAVHRMNAQDATN